MIVSPDYDPADGLLCSYCSEQAINVLWDFSKNLEVFVCNNLRCRYLSLNEEHVDEPDPKPSKTSKKRGRPAVSENMAIKASLNFSLKGHYKETLELLTVEQLKVLCKQRKIACSKRLKADIITSLLRWKQLYEAAQTSITTGH